MKNNKNQSNLVDSEVWGPYFWACLNTIVKFTDEYNDKHSKYIKIIMEELAYMLPCNTCRYHCLLLYNERMGNELRNVSHKNLSKFIYSLKSNVNKDIGKKNISYEKYETLIKRMEPISLSDLFRLLNTISIFYMHPTNNYSDDRDSVCYFIKALQILK